MMNKIYILTTGGTISAQKSEQNLFELGKISGQNLFSHIKIPQNYQLEFIDICNIDSSFMNFEILYTIKNTILQLIQDNTTKGIIITHGTDTLEESAYFLSLCYPSESEIPVIITGSQRASDEIGSDALSNLQHAIYAITSKKCNKLGVLVLFNQALLMPKYVHKTHTHFLQAFASQHYGILGTVDNQYVNIVQYPSLQEYYSIQKKFPEIEIYKTSLDSQGKFLDYIANSNIQGLIIEAFGRGNVPEQIAIKIKNIIKQGCYVVITSDCANGAVQPLYHFDGGLYKLLEYGAISGFDYSAKKARIKLGILLSANKNKSEIIEAFTK